MFNAPTVNLKDEHDSMFDETESIDSNGGRRDSTSPRGRSVTLATLIHDKILDPGQGVLAIDYLGQKYVGDLLQSGKISWKGMQFASPSSWAIYVKKQVNPSKKSGCGWNSVKYKGKKLDLYKSVYSKKHKSPSVSTTPGQSPHTLLEDENSNASAGSGNMFPAQPAGTVNRLGRAMIKYSQLKEMAGQIDANTLVECVNFDQVSGKRQPFFVTISSNCFLLIDFHCQLTTGEVVGYLGGKWNQEKQCLNVVQAFPCKCRLGDRENAAVSEEQIRLSMQTRGLSKVGWYHSHPNCHPEPTLRDINCQMQYQIKFGTSNPILGLICSPPDCQTPLRIESIMNAFWVEPTMESSVTPNAGYGVPMRLTFSEYPDAVISADLHQELTWLVDYYKMSPELPCSLQWNRIGSTMDIEDAFSVVGDMGKFQIFQTVVICATNVVYGSQIVLMVIVGATPNRDIPSERNLTTVVTETTLYCCFPAYVPLLQTAGRLLLP